MPNLSVWLVRTALLYLGLGFTFGALMLANKGIAFAPIVWRLLPSHIELVLIGWTMQLAMGVAFWILPRLTGQHKYGRERLAWVAYGLLNGGIVVVVLSQFIGNAAYAAFVGRVAECLAALLFTAAMWPRVKAFAT